MSYQVLARKWRPRHFQDMVGQEHILRMLSNALTQKRIHHAYLFTGTRGVGKTTLARILSKCLNCESGISPSPCGTCHTCQAIDAGQFLDLFEVDAASRTKVEDTRELLDNVLYPPTQGRYKIYLIDEVHMLSNHSFNALLKTLEEPPEHVKFLLATTDPKRLPITILSRCLQFHLKRITPEQIAKHLQHICATENIACEEPALERLAKAADGSMRDALSLLDQAIAYGHGTVNKADVNAMLGNVAQDDLLPLLEAIASQNGNQLFDAITRLAEHTPDFQQVLEELISLFHQIAIAQIIPDKTLKNDLIAPFSQRFSAEDVQLYYQIALLGRRDLSLASSPQQGFEMSMLRMLAFHPGLYTQSQDSAPTTTIIEKPALSTPPLSKTTTSVAEKVAATPEPTAMIAAAQWRDILPKLELSGVAYALAANCSLEKITENKAILVLSTNHQPMLNQKLKERIAEALSRYFNQPMQLEINLTSAETLSPIKQEQSEQEERLANAKQTIMQDSKVKQLLAMYDATIEVSLLS
ncbi:MAG: DNA polymerase III subunit gamma/tau [Gammaproteobacteria bacterium]|nr:DNA polymerase III subunit gamma/tau [Gammaproteobacteria bacterium]MCW5582825.1 DNA polymerase III subunit gamma/tau [Gammaproteobacteria bacterium]